MILLPTKSLVSRISSKSIFLKCKNHSWDNLNEYSILPSKDSGLTPEDFSKKGIFTLSCNTLPLNTTDKTP